MFPKFAFSNRLWKGIKVIASHCLRLPTEFHEESGGVEVGLDQFQLAVRERHIMRREVMLVVKQRAGRLRVFGKPLQVDRDLPRSAAAVHDEQRLAPGRVLRGIQQVGGRS